MASAQSPAPAPPHVVIFPYMAQGRTLPLLDISKTLASRGLKLTIITTPSNAPFILTKISSHPSISLSIIPFPRVEDLPEGCENTANLPSMSHSLPFFTATKRMKQPFEHVLRTMFENGCPPICVISDFILSWTLDSCCLFGIPRIVFHAMGVLPTLILKTAFIRRLCIKASMYSKPIYFPDLKISFTLNKSDFPESIQRGDPDDPFLQIMEEIEEADKSSYGVLANSFEDLEGEYVAALEAIFSNNAKIWCVGPVLLYDQDGAHRQKESESCPYVKWLDKHVESNGVLYVSFGSQAHLSNNQMEEIAFGLEMAGYPFIWAARSKEWGPPDDWTERVKGRGLVVRDWVEQRSILAHPAVVGFLSHCGWNSVLESLSMGVPLLAWPMDAEQPLNAKVVAWELGAGIQLFPQESVGEEKMMTVDRRVISDGVKELMVGDIGRKARERAQAIGKMARQAVKKGGSSDTKLDQLIQSLTNK
ncbi:Glycosyltransferase [Quillaja saponaria]|uniref:Glycosyltransferase n=1 Tax=Quillaja saponaria TaxID=32244 RepID=A0AAD7PNV4_QUISA|nr:Glycosyltransferase [Quillaja saponaria]